MDYAKYKNVRNASWQCLLDCNIRSLPVPIGGICRIYDIDVIDDSCNYLSKDESGRIVRINSDIVIVINNTEPKSRCRFSIAHELGHFLLGHLGDDVTQLNRARTEVKPELETQADVFAARLLAPACVLWGLDLHTAEEISEACNISLQAAGFRAERMKELYRRNRFLSSPLERKLYDQFRDFIEQNRR